MQKAPELAGLEFSSDQSNLDPLLREAGQRLESMISRFMNVSTARRGRGPNGATNSATWRAPDPLSNHARRWETTHSLIGAAVS